MRADVRRNIIQGCLGIIESIADKEYQKRSWIRGEIGTDFDETIMSFEDFIDPIVENYKNYRITDIQYHMLKAFRDRFIVFSDDNDWPPAFIDTPEWAEIIEMAKDMLRAFGHQGREREEIKSLTEEDGKYCVNDFLKNIHRIADKKYQRRVWTRGDGSEVDDFDELVCNFFDNGYPILLEYKKYGVIDNKYELLITLYNQFDEFLNDDNDSPPKFIDTLEWTEITEMAKEVLIAFDD